MFPARGRPAGLVAFLGLLAFLWLSAAAAPAPPFPPGAVSVSVSDYPLAPGDLWRYRTTTWVPDSSGRIVSEIGLTEVRVLSSRRYGRLEIAALVRTPSGSPEAGELLYVVADSSRLYYFTDPERLRPLIDGAGQALDPADAELDFPLLPGKQWGQPGMLARSDGLYVNIAGEPAEVRVPAGRFTAVPVEFRTLPDQMTTWISPRVGVVRYEYVHHGSTSREVRELLEFRHAPIDTPAIARVIGRTFELLSETGGPGALASAIAGDPALAALLGPLTAARSVTLDDGARSTPFLAGGSAAPAFPELVLEEIPDGPNWAQRLKWNNRAGLISTFLHPSADAPAPAVPAAADAGPPRPLERALAQARERLETAAKFRQSGHEAEAGLLAESAASGVAGALTELPPDRFAGLSPEGLKDLLRDEAGATFLTTRYGRRLRLDDGRLRVNIESAADLLGVETVLEDAAPPVGAAPRLIRARPGGADIFILRSRDPSTAVRRILTLDWSRDPGVITEVMVLSGGQTAAKPEVGSPFAAAKPDVPALPAAPAAGSAVATPEPASVELFRLDNAGAHATWRKDLPFGTARLASLAPTLELEYRQPDPRVPALSVLVREIYAPSPKHPGLPTLLSREITDPWIRTVADVVGALRAHDSAALDRSVADPSVRDRLAATWLADPAVSLAGAHSHAQDEAAIGSGRVVSVSLVRSRVTPADVGPEVLTLKLAPLSGENWTVVDVSGGPADAWDQ